MLCTCDCPLQRVYYEKPQFLKASFEAPEEILRGKMRKVLTLAGFRMGYH